MVDRASDAPLQADDFLSAAGAAGAHPQPEDPVPGRVVHVHHNIPLAVPVSAAAAAAAGGAPGAAAGPHPLPLPGAPHHAAVAGHAGPAALAAAAHGAMAGHAAALHAAAAAFMAPPVVPAPGPQEQRAGRWARRLSVPAWLGTLGGGAATVAGAIVFGIAGATTLAVSLVIPGAIVAIAGLVGVALWTHFYARHGELRSARERGGPAN